MKKLKTRIWRALDYLIIKLCSILPVKRRYIVLHSIPDYSDNCRAFSDYMRINHAGEGYRLIWLVSDPSRYSSDMCTRFVRTEGAGPLLKRDYYLAVSGFVVYTHGAPIRSWRKGQLFIHTTHSASQLKGEDIRKASERRTVIPDVKLRCGRDGVERTAINTGYPAEKCAVLGMPRLDLLFAHRDCLSLLFPDQKPTLTVIAMETYKQSNRGWSDSEGSRSWGLNMIASADELKRLDEYLGSKDILLIIKPHPLQDLSYIHRAGAENIRFITDRMLEEAGIQLYELLENCGVLLTDYSSIFYDYLLLDRPIGFMIGDMEEYQRGFLIANPLEEMTGPKIHDLPELIAFLDGVLAGEDNCREDRVRLKNRVFKYQDNRNCERLFLFLQDRMKSGA